MFSGFLAAGRWSEERGVNLLDTGAPWYDCYETKDGKYVAIGAIEAKFYEELLARLGLTGLPPQNERAGWPAMREAFARTFKGKTRDEWVKVFEGSDACFAPVLSFSEARRHPHNLARRGTVSVARLEQPAPAPRFSATPAEVQPRAARARRTRARRAQGLGLFQRRHRAAEENRARYCRLRVPLAYSRVRDGGDFRAGRDSGRRRVLDAHKAADGDAMHENSPRPSERRAGARASKARGARRPRVAAGRRSGAGYDNAMTWAPALLLGLAISTYRCGLAPSRRRIPAATRMRANRPEAP